MWAIIMVFVMELSLIMFAGPTYATTSLLDFASALFQGDLTALFSGINSVLLVGAGLTGALLIYGTFINRLDWILYMQIGVSLFTFVFVIAQYWQFIAAQALFGDASELLATIVCGPLAIYFTFAVLDFARGKD